MANRRQTGRGRLGYHQEHDEAWKEKRNRNNESVKKCRQKAKERTKEIYNKVDKFKELNKQLQTQISTYKSELKFYLKIIREQGLEYSESAEIEAMLGESEVGDEENLLIDNEENENAIVQLN